MTLSEYLVALKRGWVVVLLITAAAVACGAAIAASKPAVYNAATRLYVQTVEQDNKSDRAIYSVDFAANRTASYAGVLGGNVTAGQVAEVLGGSGDESVAVVAPPGTVIIDVSVTSSDPQRAADVANAYADVAPGVIENLDKDEAGQPRVEVTTFSVATVPSAPVAQRKASVVLAFALLGLGLGVSAVLVREVVRREIGSSRKPPRESGG